MPRIFRGLAPTVRLEKPKANRQFWNQNHQFITNIRSCFLNSISTNVQINERFAGLNGLSTHKPPCYFYKI